MKAKYYIKKSQYQLSDSKIIKKPADKPASL
jgi:hypothetical protein